MDKWDRNKHTMRRQMNRKTDRQIEKERERERERERDRNIRSSFSENDQEQLNSKHCPIIGTKMNKYDRNKQK